MSEQIKLRMARAYPEQVQRVREWFQKLEELLDDEKTTSSDYGIWISAHYHEVANDWERILFGYDTLIENVCDQTKSFLEFKPEIKEAMEMASGVGELIRAVGNYLEWLNDPRLSLADSNLTTANKYMDAIEQTYKKIVAGEASKPSDVGN